VGKSCSILNVDEIDPRCCFEKNEKHQFLSKNIQHPGKKINSKEDLV